MPASDARKPKPSKRKFGAYRGEFEVPDSFFEPLPEGELKAFEGEAREGDPLSQLHINVAGNRRRVRRRKKR